MQSRYTPDAVHHMCQMGMITLSEYISYFMSEDLMFMDKLMDEKEKQVINNMEVIDPEVIEIDNG